jgi:uncharacterized protein YjiS (DUF1127 family)
MLQDSDLDPKERDVSEHASALFEFFCWRTAVRPRYTVAQRLALIVETWRTRRMLAELDPRLLKDIGISRGEAQAEIARAPWHVGSRR